MSAPASVPTAFDALAPSYDEAFTRGVLGGRLRARVWRRLDRVFGPGARVLDVGCGTGEDALHLSQRGVRVVAIDASPEMVRRAREKVSRAAAGADVEVLTLTAERLRDLGATTRFDGVLANFGVLNCVEDLEAVAGDLAELARPGARAFLCVMGPVVPWEWAWYLARGRPGRAFRRLRRGGATWRGLRVRYPSVGAVRRAFAAAFRPAGARALGVLLPPTYAEPWAARRPRLVGRLDALERRIEAVPPLPRFADHYLLELVRR